MRPAPLVALAALAAFGAACDFGFAPPSRLDGLRILALRLDPPEARPLEPVALDALVWQTEDGPAPSHSWRACYLPSAWGIPSSGGGGGSTERPPVSCFDLPDALTPEELAERLSDPERAKGLDLGRTAVRLGEEPTATLVAPPLYPGPGLPSACDRLSDAQRLEQGGREAWLAGNRIVVSLQVEAGDEVVEANKRLVVRPAAERITPQEQGMPFRTPRLCEGEEQAARACARNVNPAPPRLETPNGEWSGDGPIPVAAGGKVKLRPLPPDDLQAYVALLRCGDPGGVGGAAGGEYERLETRFFAWYADAGDILVPETLLAEEEGDRESGWQAPSEAGTHALWVVARDGRGGASWARFELSVE